MTSGRVRYMRSGFEFVENGAAPAIRNEKCVAAKLYVAELEDPPFGNGDVKLNFHGPRLPDENDYISCHGPVRTGVFRDIIIDVDNWEPR